MLHALQYGPPEEAGRKLDLIVDDTDRSMHEFDRKVENLHKSCEAALAQMAQISFPLALQPLTKLAPSSRTNAR